MATDTVTDVLFDECGVLRFTNLAELCETATAFATQEVPRGNGVGMVTNAGSPAIIVTDEAVSRGLRVPDLCESSKGLLRERLQAIASVANPIDMMATASGEEFSASLQALVDDPELDSVVTCFMTPFFVDTLGIARAIEEHAGRTDKTMIAVAMTNPDEKPEWTQTLEIVRRAGVPIYYFPEVAAKVLFNMDRYRRLRDRPRENPPDLEVERTAAERLLQNAAVSAAGFLSPGQASDLLRGYGIQMVEERRVSTGNISVWDALRVEADHIGYPVVLKAEAADLIHKTDEGGVILDIRDEKDLRREYDAMRSRFGDRKGLAFLLQKQLAGGLEVIVGGAEAPGLGSTVMFGLGGVHVEVFHDVVFKLAPLSRPAAEAMLASISASGLLDGVRGRPPVDKSALVDILLRVSRLLSDFPEIHELDLNPVMVFAEGKGARVVDARIRIRT